MIRVAATADVHFGSDSAGKASSCISSAKPVSILASSEGVESPKETSDNES